MQKSTPLETILAYYHIQPFLTSTDWIELGKKLELDEKQVEDRMSGKILEDNFFLIARCYQNVEAIIVFNEVLSKITGTPSGDGLIVFKNGERVLVEVKSTKKQKCKFSESYVQSQKLLADKLGVKLVYAVYLKHYWGVYSPEYLASNNYTIRHTKEDLKSSLFDLMFDPWLVKIPQGLEVIRQFSTSENAFSSVGIFSSTYGHVVRYWVRYKNLRYQIEDTNDARAFAAIEMAISDNQKIFKRSDVQTDIVVKCLMDSYLNDCRLSIEHIQITVNRRNEQRFNASSFLTHTVSTLQEPNHLDFAKGVENGLGFIRHLMAAGFPFEIVKASETDYLLGMFHD